MGTFRSLSTISYLLLLLLIGSSLPSASAIVGNGFAPEILTERDSIVIEAGGTLNLTCRDTQRIVWLALQDRLIYENYEETYDERHDRPHVTNLVINNVNYTNVGYYLCVHNTTENKAKTAISPEDYNVTAVYVYVKDVNHLLVAEAERILYSPEVGKNFTFPCKPTFPEVTVTIDKNQGVTFDPKEGFSFTPFIPFIPEEGNVAHDVLICKAHFNGNNDSREFIVNHADYTNTKALEKPRVTVSNYWQRNAIAEHLHNLEQYDVEEESDINLTCAYDYEPPFNSRKLRWILPPRANESGSSTIHRNQTQDGVVKRILLMSHVNPLMNTGNYTCLVKDTEKSKFESENVIINVLPEGSSHVTLLLEEREPVDDPDEDVMWRVLFSAYPHPEFIWWKGGNVLHNTSNGKQGNERHKMEVDFDSGNVFLTLERPSVHDIGIYTVEAIADNGEVQARDEITLNVTMPVPPSTPAIEFWANDTKIRTRMLPQNKVFQVVCKSSGYPKPDLRLEFKQCFSKNNCTEYEDISEGNDFNRNGLRKRTYIQNKGNFVNATDDWEGKALVQGQFRCSASNEHSRAKRVEAAFLISDGALDDLDTKVEVNGHGSYTDKSKPLIKVIEADNIVILCQGNKVLTSPPLKWKINGRPITDSSSSSKYIPIEEETNFSYTSKIKMDKIPLEEDLAIVCEDSSDLKNLRDEFKIRIIPMKAPEWNTKDKPLQDLNLKEMGNLTLKCPAHGVPTPVIRWYKDDELLSETSRNEKSHRIIRGAEIIFSYLKISDSGNYKCEATNRNGTIVSQAYVSVTDPDAYVNINIIIIVCVLSSLLVILCIFICVTVHKTRKRAYNIRLEDQKLFLQGDPDNLNPELGLEEQAELLPYDTKYEVSRDSIVFDKLLGAGAFGLVYRATALNLFPGQPRTTVAVKMMKSRTDSAQLKALRSEVKIMIHIGRHVNIVNLLGACSKELATKGELLLLVEYCQHGNILDYMRRRRKDFINQINEYDRIDPSLTDARIRQRTESGSSRGRMSKGLKYAHLSFNQDMVTYTVDSDARTQSLWIEPSSPTGSSGPNGHIPETFRARTASGSSPLPVASDMSTFTFESSNGGSDNGYIGSRAVGPSPVPLCTKDLLCWAYQIAKGMEYLAIKKVLHGDLAARNILLTEDNIVKISDFGLAKDIYKNDNYRKKSKTPLPWKWLAVECFRDGVFSTQSDIWSYGVVLWEIFSLGQSPYPGVEFDESFVTRLEKGVRPDQPKYSTYDLYRIMLDCWVNEPMERPSFSTLESTLGLMIGEAERQHYLELNQECQMENTASTFVNSLQSPDYSAKIRERNPNQDQDGYEMPFSPSPLGAVALPLGHDVMRNSRLTPLQMHFMHNGDTVDGASGEDGGSMYVPMSSPTKSIQNVFSFDEDVVDSINKRDSDIQQCMRDLPDEGCPNENNYLKMQNSPNPDKSPSPPIINDHIIPLRHKLIRTASQMEKHDSGLYSPTANIQNNPNYMIMGNFLITDENNYLSKEAYNSYNDVGHKYINIGVEKLKPFQKDYVKDALSNGEYANLLPNVHCKKRTISEGSSGLGSISEESSPECKPDSLKSTMESVMEEPVYV